MAFGPRDQLAKPCRGFGPLRIRDKRIALLDKLVQIVEFMPASVGLRPTNGLIAPENKSEGAGFDLLGGFLEQTELYDVFLQQLSDLRVG